MIERSHAGIFRYSYYAVTVRRSGAQILGPRDKFESPPHSPLIMCVKSFVNLQPLTLNSKLHVTFRTTCYIPCPDNLHGSALILSRTASVSHLQSFPPHSSPCISTKWVSISMLSPRGGARSSEVPSFANHCSMKALTSSCCLPSPSFRRTLGLAANGGSSRCQNSIE
jgi:hypothetical protein